MGLIGKIALIAVVSAAVLIAIIWDFQNEGEREGPVTTKGEDIEKTLPPHITTEKTPRPQTPQEPAPGAPGEPDIGAPAEPEPGEPSPGELEPGTGAPGELEPGELEPGEPAVEEQIPELPEPPAPATKYVIQKDDTLSRVAKKFYGDANLWRAIAAANPGINDPDKLRIGTEIIIPPREEVVEVEPWPAVPESAETYIVQKGDTLTSIARAHYDGDAFMAEIIFLANKDKITNKNFLRPGTILIIPELRVQEH